MIPSSRTEIREILRFARAASLTLILAVGCRPPSDEIVNQDASQSGTGGQKKGTGGSTGSGGGSGGSAASGGSTGSGGISASGGGTSTGGTATGGATG